MRFCVIMCGGVGSRFWPFSRTNLPKQFLDFFGTGRTLLQMTYDRILPVVPPERIIVVTNRSYAALVAQQLPDIPKENILAEPARRNTAPCACWAANHIHALDSEASIVTLPSDHIVLKEDAFTRTLIHGFSFVENHDALLTIGILPKSPNTGYGYIQKGAPTEADAILKVKSFTEKPDAETARFFLESGEFFWNAGIFLWKADSILHAFDRYAPAIGDLFKAPAGVYASPSEDDFIDKAFARVPSDSIDYAIMEKADNVYVETADLGWNDIGTWKALHDFSPRNREGNVTQNCRVIAHDCRDTMFAVTGDKIVVAGGLEGYIVADTDNALLIYPIDKEQSIKQIVNEVKDRFGENFI